MSNPPISVAARDRLILALDYSSAEQAFALLDQLRHRCAEPPRWLKVGLELFLACGPSLVHSLRAQDYAIFLDLKLHDIPTTVARAVRALRGLDIELLTVHAGGGPAMLAEAAEAASSAASSNCPRLLAVTVLTSMDAAQLRAVGVSATPSEQVVRLAREAVANGVTGLVASPLEAATLRQEFGPELHLVTPGIRSQEGQDDQQRVATPAFALRAGANQLVVGRPITRAQDPAAAYDAILAEIERNRVR